MKSSDNLHFQSNVKHRRTGKLLYSYIHPSLPDIYKKQMYETNSLSYFFTTTFSYSSSHCPYVVNSSPLSAAYMRRWTGSALVQVMVCRLFGAKPLPEPFARLLSIITFETKFSEILIEIQNVSIRKRHLKMLAGEFPSQRASNAENVSIWWRHHASSKPINAQIRRQVN